jgi:septal ring factor EnvC (AmiA/AmiB activator)
MMAPRSFETKKSSGPTGPTSAAGKETVSRNALVHGLSGRTHACLPGEEGPYEQFCREMLQALTPVGILEQSVAEDIADDRWRRRRAIAMENALYSRIAQEQPDSSDLAAALADAYLDASKGLRTVALYANRLQRTIEKNTAYLESLQAKRKAAHAQAQEEAILLTQLAEANGKTYDPAPDFPCPEAVGQFVYSAPEIKRLIARASRLADAKAFSAAGLLAA